jgi:uncharacterized protein (TIGR03437 family)
LKLLITRALFAAVTLCAWGPYGLAAQIALPTLTGSPGATYIEPVTFGSQGSSVSGLQFDIQFVPSAMSLGGVLSDQAKSSGKALYPADVSPGTIRFLIVGLNQNGLQDGALINLLISVSPSALSGVYTLHVTNVVGTDSSGQAVVITGADGSITIQPEVGKGPQLQVLSAASWLAGAVSPGEIITLTGSSIGPTTAQLPPEPPSSINLGGTAVLFDGTPAPLLYAASNQINAVVPYNVSGKAATQLQVVAQGQPLATLSVPVVPVAPAIFTLDSSGVGPGAILNQDLTVNSSSNPATVGSVIAIYATGGGQTDPQGVDGQIQTSPLPHPSQGVSVLIGGVTCTVTYAGGAPGLISGALQVNAVVPTGIAPGPTVPVLLVIGTEASQSGVTVAIH